MKNCLTLLCIVFIAFSAVAQTKTVYHDMQEFTLLGRPMPNATVYQRFPDTIKNLLRKPVWDLSKNPTGFAVYFETNAKQISAKWKTGSSVVFQHVAGTLVKGLDLYGLDNGTWYFAGVGKPNAPVYQESNLVKDMDGQARQYLLYLPDYETCDSLFIGIEEGAFIHKPQQNYFEGQKPLVVYGTSIVQGASAMRPGMAYPAQLERRLGRETINLGFSGNGQLDSMLAVIMSGIDASMYVIDCGPNLTPAMAEAKTVPFLRQLHALQPNIPILLVENIMYPTAKFNLVTKQKINEVNQIFKNAYALLKKEGMRHLHYLETTNLIGHDGEATVDGAHMTDLGFYRITLAIEQKIRSIEK
jgi:hypothetical protein